MRRWLSPLSLSQPWRLKPPLLLPRRRIWIASETDSLISSLRICGSNMESLKQIHCFMITGGLNHDNLIVSKFIDACSSAGYVRYAHSVFTHQLYPNAYLHNTMIRALSLMDEPEAHTMAVMVYRKFQTLCLRPDTYTFPFVLKVVIRLSDVHLGKQIHAQTMVFGLESNVHSVTGLIQMYSSCGTLIDARKVFDEMSVRETTIWNAMIAGYAKGGEIDNAKSLLDMMPSSSRNVISWTNVISGYVKNGRAWEAIEVFQRMEMENVKPDEVMILAGLSACADLGLLELGEWIYSYVENHGLNRRVAMNNALIDMYAKSGNITKAVEVFESIKERNVITWTTIMTGLAMHGLVDQVLEMFNRMEKAEVKPNEVTFIAILSACSHVGLVDLGQWYFSLMESKYGIEPKIEHYGCMIDLLGRVGLLQEAKEMAISMPFESNAAIWGSLLGSSKVHCDVELAEQALKHLILLESDNSGNYMLLSNLYSNLGKWNESRMMRKMMKGIGVKKMIGGSSIGLRKRVFRFISGDISHPKFNEILQEIDLHSQNNELYEWMT